VGSNQLSIQWVSGAQHQEIKRPVSKADHTDI